MTPSQELQREMSRDVAGTEGGCVADDVAPYIGPMYVQQLQNLDSSPFFEGF